MVQADRGAARRGAARRGEARPSVASLPPPLRRSEARGTERGSPLLAAARRRAERVAYLPGAASAQSTCCGRSQVSDSAECEANLAEELRVSVRLAGFQWLIRRFPRVLYSTLLSPGISWFQVQCATVGATE